MWLDAGVIFAQSPTQWTAANVGNVIDALNRVSNAVGSGALAALGLDKGTLSFIKEQADPKIGPDGLGGIGGEQKGQTIRLWLLRQGNDKSVETTIHEIGHLIDFGATGVLGTHYSGINVFWAFHHHVYTNSAVSKYAVDGAPTEDFAETFTWWAENRNGNRRDYPWFGANPQNRRGTPDEWRISFVQGTIALAVRR
jgi:hypothetical protein